MSQVTHPDNGRPEDGRDHAGSIVLPPPGTVGRFIDAPHITNTIFAMTTIAMSSGAASLDGRWLLTVQGASKDTGAPIIAQQDAGTGPSVSIASHQAWQVHHTDNAPRLLQNPEPTQRLVRGCAEFIVEPGHSIDPVGLDRRRQPAVAIPVH
jgi:hypothetical protein